MGGGGGEGAKLRRKYTTCCSVLQICFDTIFSQDCKSQRGKQAEGSCTIEEMCNRHTCLPQNGQSEFDKEKLLRIGCFILRIERIQLWIQYYSDSVYMAINIYNIQWSILIQHLYFHTKILLRYYLSC